MRVFCFFCVLFFSHLHGLIITVDGPSGAGKSTVASALAKEIGLPYVNTGAMYRALALFSIAKGLESEQAIGQHLCEFDLEVYLLDERLSFSEVAQRASQISTYFPIREHMMILQRRLGQEEGGVFEGRDMGTVVFPDADHKFFLTADAVVRAKRRYADLVKKDPSIVLSDVLADMQIRDERDYSRRYAPLKQASDAVLIDTTLLKVEQTVQQMKDLLS